MCISICVRYKYSVDTIHVEVCYLQCILFYVGLVYVLCMCFVCVFLLSHIFHITVISRHRLCARYYRVMLCKVSSISPKTLLRWSWCVIQRSSHRMSLQSYPMMIPDSLDDGWAERSCWIHTGTGILDL